MIRANLDAAFACQWISYQAGLEEEWTAVRRSVRIPRGCDAPHHAIVQGLFVALYVAARDIHRALNLAGAPGYPPPAAPRSTTRGPGIDAGATL